MKRIQQKLEKIPQSSSCYLQSDTQSYHSENTIFFLFYGKDSNLPLHQILELMQCFLGDPESGLLNLEAHWLALAIVKKTLNENLFGTACKTMDREPPSLKIGNRVYFKNKQPGKWDLKWRPGYRIVHIECDRHCLHIEHQVTGKTRSCNIKDVVLEPTVEFWHIYKQFSRVGNLYYSNQYWMPTPPAFLGSSQIMYV